MQWFLQLHNFSDWGLLVLRLAMGAVFFAHGKGKWGMWKMQPSEQLPQSMLNLMKFLSVVEPLGGLAMVLGFLTPVAAIGLGVIMLGAIRFKLMVWKVPFAPTDKMGWEFDLVILTVAVALLLMGGGSLSVDHWWFGL